MHDGWQLVVGNSSAEVLASLVGFAVAKAGSSCCYTTASKELPAGIEAVGTLHIGHNQAGNTGPDIDDTVAVAVAVVVEIGCHFYE